MSVWTRAVAEAGVNASSFLDDSASGQVTAVGRAFNEWLDRLIQGLNVSTEFDSLSGRQLNVSKTKGLALKPLQRAKLQLALQHSGYDVEVRDHFVIVEGLLHTSKCQATAFFHPNAATAADNPASR